MVYCFFVLFVDFCLLWWVYCMFIFVWLFVGILFVLYLVDLMLLRICDFCFVLWFDVARLMFCVYWCLLGCLFCFCWIVFVGRFLFSFYFECILCFDLGLMVFVLFAVFLWVWLTWCGFYSYLFCYCCFRYFIHLSVLFGCVILKFVWLVELILFCFDFGLSVGSGFFTWVFWFVFLFKFINLILVVYCFLIIGVLLCTLVGCSWFCLVFMMF